MQRRVRVQRRMACIKQHCITMNVHTDTHTQIQTQTHITRMHFATTHQYLEAVSCTWDLEGPHPFSLLVGSEHSVCFVINA